MKEKKFKVVYYTGKGELFKRKDIISIPVDENLSGRSLEARNKASAEKKLGLLYPGDRGKIRVDYMIPFKDSVEDSMNDIIKNLAAKYGHEMQNDAAFSQVGSDAPYKLPFAKLASLDVGIAQAKAKLKELPQLEKQQKQVISAIERTVAKFSPEDKKVAKMVKNQYNISSKIKGL